MTVPYSVIYTNEARKFEIRKYPVTAGVVLAEVHPDAMGYLSFSDETAKYALTRGEGWLVRSRTAWLSELAREHGGGSIYLRVPVALPVPVAPAARKLAGLNHADLRLKQAISGRGGTTKPSRRSRGKGHQLIPSARKDNQ